MLAAVVTRPSKDETAVHGAHARLLTLGVLFSFMINQGIMPAINVATVRICGYRLPICGLMS